MGFLDKYTQNEIEDKIRNSKNIIEFLQSINVSPNSGGNRLVVTQYIKDNNIDISHFDNNAVQRCPENIFIKNSTVSQKVLRHWYRKGEYTEYKCSICGLEPVWNGKPLTLTLDHIDGDNRNDELTNLRWVCPNCDRQLPTFGAKKLKRNIVCKKCGKEMTRTRKTGMCADCYLEEKRKKGSE